MLKKILIMAGGTGGHIFPGIALGKAFQQKGVEVLWLGSHQGLETQLVPKAGFELFTLDISGFRGKKFLHQLFSPVRLCQAVLHAYRLLKKIKPEAVLGMGGFAAGPGGIAAKLLNIPLFIHEQNSIAGFTNKTLAKFSKKVFCAFPETFKPSQKMMITGNPVRQEIQKISPKNTLHSPPRILVFGGSRGAAALNEIVPKALEIFAKNRPLNIVHQTGQNNSAHYLIPARVVPFIDDMAGAYDWADIIICRAGALTLAELTAVGIPAILIPYPHAVDDHQTVNARFLEKNHAAIVMPQAALTPENLSETLNTLLTTPDKYQAMAQASRALGNKDAVALVVDTLLAAV
jgi:UDP-N-acetylglucosamine--N-acetylmuramyl-(pentapeptide) pyrophosphoryl-undecaprenol N-acetylglucosamine transferase